MDKAYRLNNGEFDNRRDSRHFNLSTQLSSFNFTLELRLYPKMRVLHNINGDGSWVLRSCFVEVPAKSVHQIRRNRRSILICGYCKSPHYLQMYKKQHTSQEIEAVRSVVEVNA
jgi:hypothetical protein